MADQTFGEYCLATGLSDESFPEDSSLFESSDTWEDFEYESLFGPAEDVAVNGAGGQTVGAGPTSGGWTFTTTPENIAWSMGAEVSPVKIFGSNQVPVTVGSKGMRDLTLGNTLIEGFTRGVQVDDKIAMLEALMNYSLVSGPKGGYVKVPVFRITANNKVYGNGLGGSDKGYFVIKDIQVKETMRDFSGYSTRAFVDVTFTQVPPYQVNSGVDQANSPVTGAKAVFPDLPKATDGSLGAGQSGSTSGTNVPKPALASQPIGPAPRPNTAPRRDTVGPT